MLLNVKLSLAGLLTVATGSALIGASAIVVNYELHDHLGSDARLEVAFFEQPGSLNVTPANTTLSLKWFDSSTDDLLYEVTGKVAGDIDDYSSITAIADSNEIFKTFEILTAAGIFEDGVTASDAFNPATSLSRSKVALVLPSDEPSPLADNELFDAITLAETTPSYLVHTFIDDLPLLNTLIRARKKLNVPLTIELDPNIPTLEMAFNIMESLDLQDEGIVARFNTSVCRPRDAASIRGMKKPCSCLGVFLGYSILRNAATNAKGLAKLQKPIAGYDFPMTWRAIELKPGIKLNEENLNRAAELKLNLVQPEKYQEGTRWIFGDCLTMYNSKTSALRLSNAAEIEMTVGNQIIQIAKRHMLTNTEDYITSADKESRQYLDDCVSAGWLKPAEDLPGGKPYVFSITVNQARPFDAVDTRFGSRPEGAVRANYLTQTVNK